MANADHLAFLTQGVEVWNRWRDQNPDIQKPDLSGAHLAKTDLSGAHLTEADLSGA